MGMGVGLVTISDENIARVLKHPHLIWQVVLADEESPPEPSDPLRRLFWIIKQALSPKLVQRDGEGQTTDLDKAWQGLQYLFTGQAAGGTPPLDFLITGGHKLSDIEVGYIPARALYSSEVVALNAALAGLTEESLQSRYDPDEMTRLDIYPGVIWLRDDDALEYLLEYFRVLKEFVAETAAHKLGMVITIT